MRGCAPGRVGGGEAGAVLVTCAECGLQVAGSWLRACVLLCRREFESGSGAPSSQPLLSFGDHSNTCHVRMMEVQDWFLLSVYRSPWHTAGHSERGGGEQHLGYVLVMIDFICQLGWIVVPRDT